MTDHPLVSIVTPSFNQGRYIAETIESVLNQDYPHLEYVVLDGGSTDETLTVLKRYEGRLRWISERDRGQADAINKGFRMARGEILGWLNSDDTYLPGAIQRAVEYFRTHRDVGMVYGEGYHIDARGQTLERYYTESFSFKHLAEICFICQPTVFFRAEVFKTIGALDVGLHFSLDYDYWMRVAKRFRIGYMNDYLANSRLHMETKTLSQRVTFHAEILQTVKRHFGHVPVRWLYAYAHSYLSERLLPHVQGMHADGWASQRASIVLQPDWGRYRYVSLEGELARSTCPLSLRFTGERRVLFTTTIKDQIFAIKEPLWEVGLPAYGQGIVEVTIDADWALSPQDFGVTGDTRSLAYRVRRLALVDDQGEEIVLYSSRRAALLRLVLPLLVLWKSLLVNGEIPYQELGRDMRQLRLPWHSPLPGHSVGGSSR